MKAITLTLFTEDKEIEERIKDLETRCEKLNIPFDRALQAAAMKVPNKVIFDVLLGFVDLEISDISEQQKMKQLFNKLKIQKGKEKND